MKNLGLALSLLLLSTSWFAEATCAPMTLEMKSPTSEQIKTENSGLTSFAESFEQFRLEHLKDTYLCDGDLTLKSFEHESDFARMQWSTIKIESSVLIELGTFAQNKNPTAEETARVELIKKSLMGVMTFFSYTNKNWLRWYTVEIDAALNVWRYLHKFNQKQVDKMAAEKPLMALGLGLYRVVTFNKIPEGKRAFKQGTHPTPYQIANSLVQNGQLGMARELLTFAQEKSYKLADDSKKPEMTLEDLDALEDLKTILQ